MQNLHGNIPPPLILDQIKGITKQLILLLLFKTKQRKCGWDFKKLPITLKTKCNYIR